MSGGANVWAMYGATYFARSLEPTLALIRLVVFQREAKAAADDVSSSDASCWAQTLDWVVEQAEEGRAD